MPTSWRHTSSRYNQSRESCEGPRDLCNRQKKSIAFHVRCKAYRQIMPNYSAFRKRNLSILIAARSYHFRGCCGEQERQNRGPRERYWEIMRQWSEETPRDNPNTRASCEAMMSLKPELSRLSQIDADVSEIGTRAGEADSRMYKPLQNAFGA
jgi:hypothetical protein